MAFKLPRTSNTRDLTARVSTKHSMGKIHPDWQRERRWEPPNRTDSHEGMKIYGAPAAVDRFLLEYS